MSNDRLITILKELGKNIRKYSVVSYCAESGYYLIEDIMTNKMYFKTLNNEFSLTINYRQNDNIFIDILNVEIREEELKR